MSIFKKKKQLPKTEDVKVTVTPVDNGLNPITNIVEYVVVIESNMVDLINENINEIELTSEVPAKKSQLLNKSEKNISNIIKDDIRTSYTPKNRKIKSLDPKATVSHGDLARSNTSEIKEEIEQESFVFSERKTQKLPKIKIDIDNILESRISWQGRPVEVTTIENIIKGVQTPENKNSRNFLKPKIIKKESKIIPKKTTITSRIKIGKNENIKVNLKNASGQSVARVGSTAKNIALDNFRSNNPKNLAAFKLIAKEPLPFNISISDDKGRIVLHVNSRFSNFRNFEVQIRKISHRPEKDSYKSLGIFNNASGKKIFTRCLTEENILVHVIPSIDQERMCWSQTFVHRGIDIPTTAKICSYQITRDNIDKELLQFKIYDYPATAKRLYAIREHVLSGDRKKLSIIILPNRNVKETDGPTLKSVTYVDSSISLVNSMYRYDFFAIDIRGMESHIGGITCRTFEKDTSGIRFRDSSSYTTKGGAAHQLNFSISIPDLWFPNANDDLKNPGDSIFEACRERKKIGTLQLVRHSSVGDSKIVGIFAISPDASVSDIPINVTNENAVTGNFIIDSKFNKKYGLSSIKDHTEYIYELRVGYYLLSNELSFLKNPIKLTVPNEFTNGKVGYKYHPYLHDSPLSKDFGIIPKLGESKHRLLVESLTNISKIYVFNKNSSPGISKQLTLDCTLSAKKGKRKVEPYTIIQTNIPPAVLKTLDHVEIMLNNSTTGDWTTIGRHRVTTSKFYYIDMIGPKIACNKITYALIGRNYSMENIFSTISSEISLKNHNYIEKPRTNLNDTSVDKRTSDKLR